MKYLITGGTGFLGERLIERLLEQGHEITTIARNEGKLIQLKQKFPSVNIFAGDIAVKDVIYRASLIYGGFDGIFHLAAWKFVSEAEKQIPECLRSNITGTQNVLETSLFMSNPPKFYLGISTDKAAHINGVYGASKFIMERMFKLYEEMIPLDIKYRIVRYGNVLYSTGSVLCKWKDLIQQDKEIIVTDPSATRFFWTRDQAIDLIFDCLKNANDSTPYCPEMKSMRVYDLLLAMYDKYSDRSKMKVKEIGLQAGENKNETMDGNIFSNEVEQYTIDEIKEMI
jgi:UDP-N-acetylglucosamine 4,6-dehydratase/UDP-glucose 4-epimerase